MKYKPLLACLFFLCVALAAGQARPDEDSGSPINRTIKAGVFNFDGYHTRNKDGNITGYGMDLLNLISKYSHLNFDLIGYQHSWKDMQEMLKNGEIDLVTSARRTPEREEIFAFSLPVGRNNTVLSKRLYNKKLRAGEYSTYDGIVVGLVSGSSQNKYLEPFAKSKGFKYSTIEYESSQELSNALRKGDVDAILSSNLRKPEDETVLDVLQSDNFYVIARKEDQDLIDEVNAAIEEMNLNEGDWQSNIYFRHYGPRFSNMPKFSEREQEFISAVQNGEKTINAISRPDIPPYSYTESDQMKGILPDYFSRAMQLAELPFTLIAPKNAADYAQLAASGKADIILDRLKPEFAGENAPVQGFTTNPYLVSGLARVMRTDFNGPVRSVAISDQMPLDISMASLANMDVRHYPSPQAAIAAVRKREADAAYILPYTAQMLVNRELSNDLYYTMMNDAGASFRMYVPTQTDHELITILNKAIKGLPSATLSQLGSAYVSFNAGQMSFLHYLHANPGLMLSIALATMLTCSLIFFMWLRGRWNRRLLSTTEYANHQLESQLAIVEALSRDYSNVLAINPERGTTRIVKIFGYAPSGHPDAPKETRPYDAILETYIKKKVHPDDRAQVSEALALATVREKLADSDEYTGTFRIVENDETQYYQFTFVNHHHADDKNRDLILVGFRNIDEVIRREQEQKEILEEALAKARYASAAKTAFLNNMSHDIRTPMNAIIGFTALAAANVRNAPMVQRYLGKIMTSGNHLLSLINDVLDMSRIESGKVKIEDQEVRLPEILRDLRTIAQADVKAKQLAFQISAMDVCNETIYCDRLRMNQILLNILSNAIKYTNPGGSVSLRVAQLTPPENGFAVYEFTVSDTGIGMGKEFLKHVFEPFEREQTTTVSGIQGTGLGLAITKKLVDMINGEIEVESEPGIGSVFTARFKFRVADPGKPGPVSPKFSGARALIIDGDNEVCASVSSMLKKLDVRPEWLTHGREAPVRARFAVEHNKPYAIYFVDWLLADMNGIEVVRRLRKIVGPDAPIIIITAYDWTDIESEGREAGATAFVSKPVFMSDLRRILGEAAPAAKEEEKAARPEVFTGKRLLLAEDNEMNQEIAQMILEGAGFQLDIVENGQLAVKKIAEMPENHYDLILMDVQMPVMNGYEATRAIRDLDDPLKSGIPIIAMTANAFDEDREEAINSGMNGYVAKPIDVDKLMETLRNILERKYRGAAANLT